MRIFKKAKQKFEQLKKSGDVPEESVESIFDSALADLEAVNKSEGTPTEEPIEEPVEPTEEPVEEPVEPVEEPVEEPENLEKSVSDILGEDAQTAEAIDVEPMLKAIVNATEKAVTGNNKSVSELKKSISALTGLVTKMSKVQIAEGKLLKSMMVDVQEVADAPRDRQAQLNVQERFDGGEEALTKAQATEKLESLIKSKQLSNEQCYTVEQRINRGQDLPVWFNDMKIKGEK